MSKKPVRVAVTGAAGQIGYALLFRIASGEMLGKDQPVILSLLEIPDEKAQKALKGVMMELEDCAFPLLAGMEAHSSPETAFKDVDYALLVGARPRGPGMERADLLKENARIFSAQGKAMNEPRQGGGELPAPALSPLYVQIRALLTRSLEEGEWKPGEPIPSEMELAARFKVSQGTVRKAVDEMAADNLLVRRQDKGTFVATHAEERTQFRFLRLVPDDNGTLPLARRFIECRRQRAPLEVTRALSLKSGDTAVQVRRLLLDRGRPVVLDDLWLAGASFKGLSAERLSQYRGPLYGLFEAEFGVRMIRAEEKIRAVAADAAAALLLELPQGAPLLSVERLSYTYGDRPVEWRRGLYSTATHYYRNELG